MPTLEELRRSYEQEQEARGRFHKHICPVCGALVTNQAMGRAAHIRMHKRYKKSASDEPKLLKPNRRECI